MSQNILEQTFAIKVQLQALLESIDRLPKSIQMRDTKLRLSNFSAWLEQEQQKATFGFVPKESIQFIQAVEKIHSFADEIHFIIIQDEDVENSI